MFIQDLQGKWRLDKWENFEEFMKEVIFLSFSKMFSFQAGVGIITRKAGNAALNFRPTVEIIINVNLDFRETENF